MTQEEKPRKSKGILKTIIYKNVMVITIGVIFNIFMNKQKWPETLA